MTWFEFKHALRDLRARRGWYGTYGYCHWRLLKKAEWWLRRHSCSRHGHLFPGGDNGEWKTWTWKHFCVTCGADAPYEWRV